MDEPKYEYKTIGMAQYWLEQGWYTVKQLEDLLEHNRRMNERLRKSMDEVSEHVNKLKHRNKAKK